MLKYGDALYHVARRFSDRDEDRAEDLFLTLVEGLALSDKGPPPRFMLRFSTYLASLGDHDEEGFPSWLTTVCTNLCRDWCRVEYGRRTLPAGVSRLGEAAVLLYKHLYWQGSTRRAAEEDLLTRRLVADERDFQDLLDQVEALLGTRRRWSVLCEAGRRSSVPLEDFHTPTEDATSAPAWLEEGSYVDPLIKLESEDAAALANKAAALIREELAKRPVALRQALGLWAEGIMKAKDIVTLCELPDVKWLYREVEKFKADLRTRFAKQGLRWEDLEPALGFLDGILEV